MTLRCTLRSTIGAAALAALLAGCGGAAPGTDSQADKVLPNGMTVKQRIESRQNNLKEMAAAMKTIGDQMKSSAPSLDQIRPAVARIRSRADELSSWFPEGTGPEAGVETEATAKIWEDPSGFQAAARRLIDQSSRLSDLATGDDLAAIGAQVGAVGAACKNCHDNFRLQKD